LPWLLRTKFGWVILLAVGAYYVGSHLFAGVAPARRATAEDVGAETANDPNAAFAAFVLDDAQNTWSKLLGAEGRPYRRAKLVLFTQATPSGCGYGRAATGPFYCPADERIYLDLSFFRELDRRFGAPGDFAQAYVIAHEIGHHVQHLAGTTERVHRAASREQAGENGLSVRLELQADCFAGVWGHATNQRRLLDAGDVEEGLRAAAAIGDDRLQRQGTGAVQPESWTHGSSAQRARWLRRGLDTGRPNACDTFSAETL
jgi:predicted metalloprotease